MSNHPIIYKKFHNYKPIDNFKGHQWFALKEDYGTEYGNISRSYQFKKEPKLLDIGNANVREMIENEIKKDDSINARVCHPDEQYSGTKANKKCHDIIKQIFGDEYDGTVIDEDNLHGNETYSSEDLEGPSEIVIWKDYNDLLKELPNNDIGKGINNKKKIRRQKSNKRRTNKRKTNKRRTNKRRIEER